MFMVPLMWMAYDVLEDFAKKWGSKYAYAIKSWKDNWAELTAYFDYPIVLVIF